MFKTAKKCNVWKSLLTVPMIALIPMLFSFCGSQDNKVPVSDSDNTEYLIDTVTIFDPNTYEERTIIYKIPASVKTTSDGTPVSAGLVNGAKGYTLDTVVVYDPVTKKEKLMKITVVPDKK